MEYTDDTTPQDIAYIYLHNRQVAWPSTWLCPIALATYSREIQPLPRLRIFHLRRPFLRRQWHRRVPSFFPEEPSSPQ